MQRHVRETKMSQRGAGGARWWEGRAREEAESEQSSTCKHTEERGFALMGFSEFQVFAF